MREYRYTHRGITILSLGKLAKWQVVELVKNRLEADAADRAQKDRLTKSDKSGRV